MSEAAIQNAMEAARIFLSNTEERRRYVNREMARMDRIAQLENAQKEGREIGWKEGREIGQKEGQEIGQKIGEEIGQEEGVLRMSKLVQILLTEGRTADIPAATSDPVIRSRLFQEYGL